MNLKNFDVIPILRNDHMVKIKSIEEKWKNFPSCVVDKNMLEDIAKLKDFHVYDDDIFLFGYPRSGTTLLQEMIWLIVNNFDVEKARNEITDFRFPILESFGSIQKFYDVKNSKTFDDLSRPRTIKSHLPVQFLPNEIFIKNPKIIHVCRGVKDVAVSMYHFAKDMMHFEIPLDEFLQSFLDDETYLAPYREHVNGFKKYPNFKNILYMTYEEMNANIELAIKKVATFLDKPLTDDQIDLLKNHLSIDNMKKNKGCNNSAFMKRMNEINQSEHKIEGFIRKGKIGGFKDEMTAEFIEKFELWMKEELKSGFE